MSKYQNAFKFCDREVLIKAMKKPIETRYISYNLTTRSDSGTDAEITYFFNGDNEFEADSSDPVEAPIIEDWDDCGLVYDMLEDAELIQFPFTHCKVYTFDDRSSA